MEKLDLKKIVVIISIVIMIAGIDDTPKNRTVSLIDKFTANDKEKI
jgi:hypothetical protein